MSPSCAICERGIPAGAVCKPCTDALVDNLATLAWLAGELTVTRARQDRLAVTATAAGRGEHDPQEDDDADIDHQLRPQPMPFHHGAAQAYRSIHTGLRTWVRLYNPDWRRMPARPGALAHWLAAHPDRWRGDPQAAGLAGMVERETTAALAVINPPEDQQTFGVCGAEHHGQDCTAYLYGPLDAAWVRCPRCGTQHETRDRRDAMRRRMETVYLRAATLARVLPRLVPDRPVSASNIRNWHRDGRPIKTRVDDEYNLTYHCGDVIAVAVSTPTRNRKTGSAA